MRVFSPNASRSTARNHHPMNLAEKPSTLQSATDLNLDP
jgi:hypothetical protein